MIAVQKWLDDAKLKAMLIMQVHDELVLEVPDAEIPSVKAQLVELMQSIARLDVPLIVDVGVGENWDKAH
jgi:DNA polymerase-1